MSEEKFEFILEVKDNFGRICVDIRVSVGFSKLNYGKLNWKRSFFPRRSKKLFENLDILVNIR